MNLTSNDIIKIIVLINAKSNGWTILYEDIRTFYLIKNKNKNKKKIKFSNEMIKLCKKPLNLEKVLNEINNKKNL
jgi:hypothetical protein